MANWIKVNESSDGAIFINLDGAVRFDTRDYSGGGGRVRIYFNGTDVEVSSEREQAAYEKIMAYLGENAGHKDYAEEGAPEGEDEVSES